MCPLYKPCNLSSNLTHKLIKDANLNQNNELNKIHQTINNKIIHVSVTEKAWNMKYMGKYYCQVIFFEQVHRPVIHN